MTNVKYGMKKAASLLMSAVLSVSVFSVMGNIDADAVTYSEMSALDQYKYTGNDLGANYSPSSTTFKVWAPTASDVKIKRYKTGSDSESGAAVIETKAMNKNASNGVWSVTISGDLKNTYYTYLVTAKDAVTGVEGVKETVDIYARSTGVNGMRGMVVDLDSTDPAGWENDKRVKCPNQTDAIIWEAHVRDFSSSSDSGMTNKGKYLAFTETGTTVNGDGIHKTGIDYLEDLGVTHVHLLPVYDYGSVDETKLSTDQFNWGYDPMNYNTPEGSYSTNPYDGSVRVKEFKQMVQALHKKNIGVVMDVVYNHTYAGSDNKNDWFNYTVPNYYYRQNAKGGFSNASGCGNETASDRAMYQKYMIDSLTYWATEYHLDGFRFDLMGVHDTDTMNAIRTALDKIDPDILIYGEPWTADATTCPKTTATQPNMKYVSEEIAAFNDKVRDAIKGSCFNAADPGFIQGAGFEEALKGGIQASSTTMSDKWSKQPSQTVTYTSAHDNYTLYDKLVKSCKGGSGYGNRYDDLVAMNKLAGGIILTSQGISFFQAGEEFARSKYGDENSYKSPTSVNQLKWQNTITYKDIYEYYKGLIEIRKAYSPFRDPTNTSNGTIYFSWGTNMPKNVVAFTMYNKINPGSEWDYVAVIHNANAYEQTVTLRTYDDKTLPSQWVIVANGTKAGTVSLGTTGSTVTVPGRSTMVLVDKTSFDNTSLDKKCTVTVNHVANGQTYKTETLKGNEGTSYTTSPLSELIDQGYSVTSTGATSGTFSKAGATVTYTYTIDPSKIGTVTVKYQDTTGKSIASDDTLTGLIGKTYSCQPKTVKGYEYVSATGSTSGTFSQTPATVIFKYQEVEEDTLKVHYYNSNGWSAVCMYVYSGSGTTATQLSGAWPGKAMTKESDNWYVGEVNTTESALFIANNNNAGSQDPTGVGSTGYNVQGEVWIKSGKVYPTGKVNVTYTTQDGKLLASKKLSGMADGTNKYTTSAKTFDGYTLTATPSNATGAFTQGTVTVNYVYKSNQVVPQELKNTSSISAETIKLGDTVTANGSATGGTAPYQYQVVYKKASDSKWTTAQNYSTNSSVTFKPASATSYDVCIKVKDSAGTEIKNFFTLTVTGQATLAINSSVSPTSITLGSTFTAKASATGGSGSYKYAFYYRKTTDTNWTTKQDFKANSTVSIKPAKATKYEVCIKVKDSEGTVAKQYFTVKVIGSEALAINSSVSPTSVTLGSTFTAKASATGGSGSYKYAFYYRKTADTNWTTKQDFKANSTVSIKPAKATTYEVCIKVKDSDGTVAKQYFTVKVTSGELTNKSTISSTSVTLGNSITLTGAASGGAGSYKYAAYYKSSSAATWNTRQDFSSNNYISIKFSGKGTKDVCIKVKDSSGTVDKKYFVVTVK